MMTIFKRRQPRWPPPTKWQMMLMGNYLRHRQFIWDWEDKKKELSSAKLNSTVQPKFKPWLAYHE